MAERIFDDEGVLEQGKLPELRVKHLEMVQSVVSRMAGQSATLKNYCLTLTTALCGLAVTLQEPLVGALALLPIFIFALLDAQYLRMERQFRGLFERVRAGDWATPPTFEISRAAGPDAGFGAALWSWSIGIFYGPLTVAVVLFVLIAWSTL